MSKSNFETFKTKFWKNYEEKKFNQITKDIPAFLKIECVPANVDMYQKLCVFTIIALDANKTDETVADTHVTAICNKYQTVIANAKNPYYVLQYFTSLEYLCTLNGLSETVYSHLVDSIAPAVLNRITTSKHSWTNLCRQSLNRFIVVLVELESQLASPKFRSAKDAITFFSTLITDDRKTAYPEHLLCMLNVLMSYRDEKADSAGELMLKFRSLISTKSGILKDIALMMSQIIRASRLLISKGSIMFKQKMFVILNDLYEIIRNKSLPSFEYTLHKTYDKICCVKFATHAGLQIMETLRTIFVESTKSDSFNEVMVSVMSNFATAEADAVATIECPTRTRIKSNLWQTLRFVVDNIEKIVTTCGLERAKRTLLKFLGIQSLEISQSINILNGLLKMCKGTDNKAEQISWNAMKLMFSTDEKNRISCMFAVHELQKELTDPKQFETISSIVKGLPKKNYPLQLDVVRLQMLQLTVEIDYPRLPAMLLQKLVDDMREMDFYKNDHSCYANLCKSCVCHMQCLAHYQHYKSNVKCDAMFDPLNEEFVSLKKESKIIVQLEQALDHLAKFVRDKDTWMGKNDSAGHITLAEKVLQRIGETLINRHYKDVAVVAFDLFYKFAKLVDRPLNQMIAAGYLIENIHLASTIAEKEIVTDLQSFIMQKLRAVDSMTDDELGSFLFSFLQLTMYTMRHQRNIEHAKKYMQAINKLLKKYDSKKAKYLAVRLKYAEVMFELIVKNPDTTIAPVIFIEDIFHRFKSMRLVSRTDYHTVPGIALDLLITLYEFTQPRYELRLTSSLNTIVHFASIRNGYLFLLAKTAILTSSENVLVNGHHLEDFMKQLDVLFDCPSQAEPTKTEGDKATWNKDITSLIHPITCTCFQCKNKFLNSLTMDVATVKALTIYYHKDYEKSLDSFKRIYNHWTALNTLSYSCMLMYYSNCLTLNHREDKSNVILNEALDVCNDYAQAQDISIRLVLNTKREEMKTADQVHPYADEVRPRAVPAVSTVKSKKKVTSKPSLPVAATAIKERKYPKRSNLRN